MVVNVVFYISPKFKIEPRSYASGVTLQSCCDKSLHCEDIKANFEMEHIQFGRT
jgi:hypothetical protein